jgi:hypothetical protein
MCVIKKELADFKEKFARIIQIFLSKGLDPNLDAVQLFRTSGSETWHRMPRTLPTCARLTILTRQSRQGRGSASRFFVLPPIPRYSLPRPTHSQQDHNIDRHIRISVATVLWTRILREPEFLAGSGQLRIRNEFEIKLLWQDNKIQTFSTKCTI